MVSGPAGWFVGNLWTARGGRSRARRRRKIVNMTTLSQGTTMRRASRRRYRTRGAMAAEAIVTQAAPATSPALRSARSTADAIMMANAVPCARRSRTNRAVTSGDGPRPHETAELGFGDPSIELGSEGGGGVPFAARRDP